MLGKIVVTHTRVRFYTETFCYFLQSKGTIRLVKIYCIIGQKSEERQADGKRHWAAPLEKKRIKHKGWRSTRVRWKLVRLR